MMMPDLNTAELRKLLKKATPGPWSDKSYVCGCCSRVEPVQYIVNGHDGMHLEDSALIVALRNAAPALLDEIDRLTKERDALKRDRDSWTSDFRKLQLASDDCAELAIEHGWNGPETGGAAPVENTEPLGAFLRKIMRQLTKERDAMRDECDKLRYTGGAAPDPLLQRVENLERLTQELARQFCSGENQP